MSAYSTPLSPERLQWIRQWCLPGVVNPLPIHRDDVADLLTERDRLAAALGRASHRARTGTRDRRRRQRDSLALRQQGLVIELLKLKLGMSAAGGGPRQKTLRAFAEVAAQMLGETVASMADMAASVDHLEEEGERLMRLLEQSLKPGDRVRWPDEIARVRRVERAEDGVATVVIERVRPKPTTLAEVAEECWIDPAGLETPLARPPLVHPEQGAEYQF